MENAAPVSREKLLAPAGHMSRARRFKVCLTLVRKKGEEKTKGSSLRVLSIRLWPFLQHDRLHLRLVRRPSGPAARHFIGTPLCAPRTLPFGMT